MFVSLLFSVYFFFSFHSNMLPPPSLFRCLRKLRLNGVKGSYKLTSLRKLICSEIRWLLIYLALTLHALFWALDCTMQLISR